MTNIIYLRNAFRAAVAGSALLVSLVGGAAYAKVDVSSTNDKTGSSSENTGTWKITNHNDVDISNHGNISNDRDIEVETGDTKLYSNTKIDGLATGDITGDISVSNELGSGDVTVAGGNGMGDISADLTNSITGANSENENTVTVKNDMNFDLRNEAIIRNDLDLNANTGDNSIKHNTVVGDVSTGDIHFSSSTENKANNNFSDIDISGLVGANDVNADFTNGITGANSENENEMNVDNKVDFNVYNKADIKNDTDINANTGDNKIDSNTCVGDISTGSVSIDVSTTNMAN